MQRSKLILPARIYAHTENRCEQREMAVVSIAVHPQIVMHAHTQQLRPLGRHSTLRLVSDLVDEFLLSDDVCTSRQRLLRLLSLCEDSDAHDLTSTVRQRCCSAYGLVGLSRVEVESDGQLDGLVECRRGAGSHQSHGRVQRVRHRRRLRHTLTSANARSSKIHAVRSRTQTEGRKGGGGGGSGLLGCGGGWLRCCCCCARHASACHRSHCASCHLCMVQCTAAQTMRQRQQRHGGEGDDERTADERTAGGAVRCGVAVVCRAQQCIRSRQRTQVSQRDKRAPFLPIRTAHDCQRATVARRRKATKKKKRLFNNTSNAH